MERFRPLGGLILSKDTSELKPGDEEFLHLTGGRNMLKRSLRGYRRRPGFGALNVESAAAIGIGTTDPKAVWPVGGLGSDTLMGLDDGTLKLYDSIDSFDQISKGFTNGYPTYGELGGYHVFSTGGEAFKYLAGEVPSRLGSKTIFEGEEDEDWSAGNDTNYYHSGNAAAKREVDNNTFTTTFTPSEQIFSENSSITLYRFGLWGGATLYSQAQKFVASTELSITTIRLKFYGSGGSFTQDSTFTLQGSNGDTPNGVVHDTATVSAATLNGLSQGDLLDVSLSKTVSALEEFWFVMVPHASETGWCHFYGSPDSYGSNGAYALDGVWTGTPLRGLTAWAKTDDSLDLYTNYPNSSKITMQLSYGTEGGSHLTEGAGSFVQFRTSATDYFEYRFAQADFAVYPSWGKLQLQRGSRYGDNSDFTVTGSPDWADITDVHFSIQNGSGLEKFLFDNCYIISPWAPIDCKSVHVANGRAFAISGRIVYYSEKWNPNRFYVDSYLVFPTDVRAVVEAGPMVLFLMDTGAWKGIPLTSFPDYKVEPLSVYGAVSSRAYTKIMYKGVVGAAWITQNNGIKFWDGRNPPITISELVGEIFTDSGSSNQNFDFTRADEACLFYHSRWRELWVIYPSLLGETNLKYGMVLKCDTGEWAPLFEWYGDSNLEYANVYRDANDNLFKIVAVDSGGLVWHEGFTETTALSATTSNDGYVDGSTTGNAVKGYLELPFIGGKKEDKTDKDQTFRDINVKYLPGTTAAFSLDFDYKLAGKGTGIDKEITPNEEEVVFGSTWTSIGNRSTTASADDDVVERNVKVGADIKGHGLAVRVGQVDSGGPVEWELYGIGVKGYPRYGER